MFNRKHDLQLIVRSHSCVDHGYEFFADKGLCTIFSATNYMGKHKNKGAMLEVGPELRCQFHTIEAFNGNQNKEVCPPAK